MPIFSSVYDWWQSFGPLGLVGEFLAVFVLAFVALWFTCRTRSSVFWKRTDYAYFLFAILGGAAGAADLAVNNWTKQLEQLQQDTIISSMSLRGYVSYASSICEKQNETEKERAKFGPDVIDPNTLPQGSGFPPSSTIPFVWGGSGGMVFGLPGFTPFDALSIKVLSAEDCVTVEQIVSDLRNDSLKDAVQYGLKITETDDVVEGTFMLAEGNFWTGKSLMSKIGLSISHIMDVQTKKAAINKQLSTLNYLGILKSLSPILLGLGIGIRFARTHYDVKAEERKTKIQQSVAVS
jgi:hypothetical protein